jgi:hypothetical protein
MFYFGFFYDIENKSICFYLNIDAIVLENSLFNLYFGPKFTISNELDKKRQNNIKVKKYFIGVNSLLKFKNLSFETGLLTNIGFDSSGGIIPYLKFAYNLELL